MGPAYWIKIDGTEEWKIVSEANYRFLMRMLIYHNSDVSFECRSFCVSIIYGVVTNGGHPDQEIVRIREENLTKEGFRKGIEAVVKYLEGNPMLIPLGESTGNITLSVKLTNQIEAIKKLEYKE